MPWVRIDEHAMSHPKISGLSDGAFRLWVQALAHCQNFLTDGVVVPVALKGLPAYTAKRRTELVAAGLWNNAPDAGILVHDYLQWNESREQVVAAREREKDRKRKWRLGRQVRGDAGRDAGKDGGRTPTSPVRACVGGTSQLVGTAGKGEGGTGETPPKVVHAGPRLRVWQWMHDDLARRLGAQIDAFDLLGWYGRLEAELERTGEGFADPWRWLQQRLYRDANLPMPNLFGSREKRAPGVGVTGPVSDEKRKQLDALTIRAGGER